MLSVVMMSVVAPRKKGYYLNMDCLTNDSEKKEYSLTIVVQTREKGFFFAK
jgi:hypothetical protein